MPTIRKGSKWTYKHVEYLVIRTHEEKLSQDSQGNWVPTVEYRLVARSLLSFYRPVTEFLEKFRTKDDTAVR